MLHEQQQIILIQSSVQDRECTIFTPAQLLCNRHQQWPGNNTNLQLRVSDEVRKVRFMGDGLASHFISVLWYVTVLGLYF
jgi:hypothetical protein